MRCMRVLLLFIHAGVFVCAVRRHEDASQLGTDLEDETEGLTAFVLTDLESHVTSVPASVVEHFSAEEMQRLLLDFLKKNTGSGMPKFKQPSRDCINFLDVAKTRAMGEALTADSCQEQLGRFLVKLTKACKKVIRRKRKRLASVGLDVSDYKTETCAKSVMHIFLMGKRLVQVVMGSAGAVEEAGFLERWINPLAAAETAAVLWAGFWTNVSDPEGHKSRTSKEQLFHFADLIESQTVHPATKLGQIVEHSSNLEACQGPMENELKGNMWSYFSYAFVRGMLVKKQDMVVALVHKEMDGARPLDESILFQYEMPAIGEAAWGMALFWSPQVVLIDLLGTCHQTGPVLRRQLFSGLPKYYALIEGATSAESFLSRSRLSWTCLDCPHSRCQLEKGLAKQVKSMLKAKRQQDETGAALIKAVQDGNFSQVDRLLQNGADVNVVMAVVGDTPLHFAVRHGDFPIAKLLLKHGAHVTSNAAGQTPLLEAKTSDLRKLLEHQ